jgi:hypothetical protein
MQDASPDSTLALGDPGDDVALRFRYQWIYAAIVCCMLLDDLQDCAEVFCEHHEDILVKLRSGQFRGLQVKTREGSQDLWKTSDEAVKSSFARFCRLEQLFPGQFESFRFLTNHQLHSAGNGLDLCHVLRQMLAADTLDSLATATRRYLRGIGLDPIPRTGNGLILKPMITRVQGCPRRRSALATNRPPRWATRVLGRGFRGRRVSFQS